eukprot:Polyplicarium_translucidae@DN3178_c0_g2_i3.p1
MTLPLPPSSQYDTDRRARSCINEFDLWLHYVSVGPCSPLHACTHRKDEILAGLHRVDWLKIHAPGRFRNTRPQVCDTLQPDLENKFTRNYTTYIRKKKHLNSEHQAQLCAEIADVLIRRGDLELRMRVSGGTDSACNHHRLLREVSEGARKTSAWYAKGCACDLSWHYQHVDAKRHRCTSWVLKSSDERIGARRKDFEMRRSAAELEAERWWHFRLSRSNPGVFSRAQRWMRQQF